ncbi:MAG: hypothetical protein GX808_00895 [Syntrophomonadaceae bacterium]|jgi:hypothetical protein|nr:hypothetical protein [Syntrophomonadaceae bacterium]
MVVKSKDYILQALAATRKRIEGIKTFHIPVVKRTIEEYEKAGADQHFIDQQKQQLLKLYAMIGELESKTERLRNRL